MASPAKIERVLPDTLPEDFSEWDGEGSESPASGGYEPPPSFAVPTPPAPPIRRMGSQAQPRAANMASAARANSSSADAMRSSASAKAAAMRDADEILLRSIQSSRTALGKQPRPNRNWRKAAVVSFASILVLLVLGALLYRGRLPMLRHTVEANRATASTEPPTAGIRPRASMPFAASQQPAAATAHPLANREPSTDKTAAAAPQAQSKMMQAQLNAPTRIPRSAEVKAADEPPSSLNIGAANLGGGNSAIGSIFNGQTQANVNAATAKAVAVSAGVAGGLLMQRTDPIYPDIAKAARISGTVVLKATISKTGIIKDLHVVSGPAMLTQAAADAVRTWRYKPYKLNNDPVEIETTIHVIFTLGG